jgi:hypothetical protein
MAASSASPRIVFIGPDGYEEVAPLQERLRALMLDRGDDYWAWGPGSAALEAHGSRLILIGRDPHGFFLIHEAQAGDWCASGPAAPGTVTAYVGGEPMEIARRNMIDRETAWQVVADYMRDGRRSALVAWEEWL